MQLLMQNVTNHSGLTLHAGKFQEKVAPCP